MTTSEKRSLLASWASDANAVPNFPALRRLENGSIVLIDEVLDALKELDRFDETKDGYTRVSRGHWSRLSRRWRQGNDDDDDDDPPSPATTALPPRAPTPQDGLAAAA
jgi:hypothetical protein